jgi:hypothetical protein
MRPIPVKIIATENVALTGVINYMASVLEQDMPIFVFNKTRAFVMRLTRL